MRTSPIPGLVSIQGTSPFWSAVCLLRERNRELPNHIQRTTATTSLYREQESIQITTNEHQHELRTEQRVLSCRTSFSKTNGSCSTSESQGLCSQDAGG